jgi:hypothetical protein
MKHIHTFEDFLHEANRPAAAIEMDRVKKSPQGRISIHGNPDKYLSAEFGKDLEIPEFPKSGDITWKGEKIGFVNKFNGVVFTDMKWLEDNLDSLNKVVAKTGFWYV